MNLYDAIFVRKSIRRYKMEPIDNKIIENLKKFVNHIEMLSEKQKVNLNIIDNLNGKRSIKGSFLVKAPYYLVLSAAKNGDYFLNAGYVLEQIALYLTTKGLSTCFLELHNKSNFETENGYEPILMLAFGKGEKLLPRESINRLKMEELCTFKTAVGDNIRVMLQAARYAPSILNNQPWRFVVYENRIHIFCKKEIFLFNHYKKLKQMDVGMMMANMLVAAEELWSTVELVKRDNIVEKRFKKNQYVTTVVITR
jgi:nitroreductase